MIAFCISFYDGRIDGAIKIEKYLHGASQKMQSIMEEEQAPVLLIDELDRSDEEFEAFLLELLSVFQISIPELGTNKAKYKPYLIHTSNRTRELSDALKQLQFISFGFGLDSL